MEPNAAKAIISFGQAGTDNNLEPINILLIQLQEIARGSIEILPQLLVGAFVIFLAWLINKAARSIIRRVLGRTSLRQSLKDLFALLASIFIWVMGFIVAAVIIFPGLTPASILAGLGIGSVAIGFAFKDVFENFLAGIIILFRREMRIGDFIECEGLEGRVDAIAVRESHIMQTDGQLVIVPNSMLFKNPLKVRTHQTQRRTTVICGVGYGEDVDKCREVITKAVETCETVITDGHPIQVFAQEFGSSSIDFEVTWWTGSKPLDIRKSRDEVIAAIKRALDDAGVEIPFPYRTLTFKEPLALERSNKDDDNAA